MKKILLGTLIITALTACQKPEDTPKAGESATPEPVATTPAPAEHNHAHDNHTHANHEHHHDHAEHDHNDHDHHHGHDHSHHDGDKYQCGDKTVHIAVHDHEGEIEAHLTSDDITYDLEQDVQTKGRFTTDDSIAGDDQGMALTLDGNTAKITTLDDTVLLDCNKAS